MPRLIDIIKGLQFACSQTGLVAIQPSNILDNAVKIMISENIDKSKKENIKQINAKEKDTDITDKQKAFLIKIKKYKEGMTKQDAFKVIQEFKNSKKEEY